VISYDCWQNRFRGDPSITGKTVRVQRAPFTIVGVAPRGFFGVAPGLAPEITLPLRALPALKPDEGDLRNPQMAWLHLIARLRPGISRERANSALQVFWPRIMDAVTDRALPAARRAHFLGRRTALVPGETGFSRVRRQFARPLLVLFALVGLLLLVACASVASLLLVRGAAREREIAVRFALGAGRGRVVRQLLVEGGVLAVIGAVGGVFLANWAGNLLVSMLSTAEEPVSIALAPDTRILAFTAAVALVTAVLFALAPALGATRVNPAPALKESARGVSQGLRRRLARPLVVSQIALATLLLCGAALFARSLHHLTSIDPGFDHRRILLVQPEPLLAGYQGARLEGFYAQLLERVRSTPGVESASLSWVPPVSDDMGAWTENITVDGVAFPPSGDTRTFFNLISPGYFATVGQTLLRGRDFGSQDALPATRTCIITQSVVRAFFPRQDPIGRHISIGRAESRQNMQIVGVVNDTKYQRLQEPTRLIAYVPYTQHPEFLKTSSLIAEVRTAVPPAAMAAALRAQALALDPALLVRFEMLSERIRESLVTERVVAAISAFLGAAALLLASTAMYGLLAYSVSRRTAEIGLRLALGAPRRAVRWIVLRDSLVLSVVGLALGLAAAVATSRFAAALLHGIAPQDPAALGGACIVILLIALAAGYLPARRAARVDPIVALRHE
jgi:predicted permease